MELEVGTVESLDVAGLHKAKLAAVVYMVLVVAERYETANGVHRDAVHGL
jgi:hypothetical protein